MQVHDRRQGRRAEDVKRQMLEESMLENPKFLVTVVDEENGLYSFYYQSYAEARDMVSSLGSEGVAEGRVALYQRIEE